MFKKRYQEPRHRLVRLHEENQALTTPEMKHPREMEGFKFPQRQKLFNSAEKGEDEKSSSNQCSKRNDAN
jgi:hypothetical protein